MILSTPGRWEGKGNLLTLGSTRSQPMLLTAVIDIDDTGTTIIGDLTLTGFGELPLSVRIAEDDTGLYAIDLHLGGRSLDGSAKMESLPNMGFLWSEDGSQTASFTLFDARDTLGCRGFARLSEATYTWEMALQPFQAETAGDNVVSLRNRRPRR
ncbi:MAG: hypothetical protein ACR2PZ_12195 [Pseudomonadales bacterium]